MSDGLDDIESRINDGIYGDDRMSNTARDDAFSALAMLLAEVKRLRAEVATERAAVVAYLTGENAARCRSISDEVAMRIERGEHRREETK
jgi:hypothetical protein